MCNDGEEICVVLWGLKNTFGKEQDLNLNIEFEMQPVRACFTLIMCMDAL